MDLAEKLLGERLIQMLDEMDGDDTIKKLVLKLVELGRTKDEITGMRQPLRLDFFMR